MMSVNECLRRNLAPGGARRALHDKARPGHSVWKSRRAVQVNIAIMRAFDAQFVVVFQAIRSLLQPAARPKRRIGFYNAER